MKFWEPYDTPDTPVATPCVLWRGINKDQFRRLRDDGWLLRPWKPRRLGGWPTLTVGTTPYAHVLSYDRSRCVSFSLSLPAALYYGTSGRTEAGYLVKVVVHPCESINGNVYRCRGGIGLIDPRRYTAMTDVYLANIAAHNAARSRARVDDEILLAEGAVQVIEVYRIGPINCDPNWRPWVEGGERLNGALPRIATRTRHDPLLGVIY